MDQSEDRFYARLPIIEDFKRIARPESFEPLPDDWHVLVADITSSTKAIESGLYKHVNILGGASIMAVLNIVGDIAIPYVFGGDGAILCVPPGVLADAHDALRATRLLARQSFNLDLRVGSVPVAVLRANGHDIRVTRYRVSKKSVQAVFAGDGVDVAEDMVKQRAPGAQVLEVDDSARNRANFRGLECRWQDIKSPKGEIVCLIAKSLAPTFVENRAEYEALLDKIEEIYGDEAGQHPLNRESLNLALSSSNLTPETLVQSRSTSLFDRFRYLTKLRLLVVLGKLLMAVGVKAGKVDWGRYKDDLISNTDFRRFIESYRQILSGTPEQRTALLEYLESRERLGALTFGVHTTDRALMTCLVFDYSGDHVHFLDGADGGFTMAASHMKDKARRRAARTTARDADSDYSPKNPPP